MPKYAETVELAKQLFINSAKGFFEDRCMQSAAALAYTTLFALVPLAVLTVVIFSAFPAFQSVVQNLQDFASKNLVAHSADVISTNLNNFIQSSRHLSIVGICFLIVVSVLMIFNMEKTFNRIWRVPLPRRGLSGFLMYWGVLTLIPLLLGVLVLTSHSITSMVWYNDVVGMLGIKALIVAISPFLVILFALLLVYLTLPNCHVPFLSALIASVVTTVCFVILRVGYAIYISHAHMQMNIYGAFSVIPFFLTWIFCNWLLVLFGVELSYHAALMMQRLSNEEGVNE